MQGFVLLDEVHVEGDFGHLTADTLLSQCCKINRCNEHRLCVI